MTEHSRCHLTMTSSYDNKKDQMFIMTEDPGCHLAITSSYYNHKDQMLTMTEDSRCHLAMTSSYNQKDKMLTMTEDSRSSQVRNIIMNKTLTSTLKGHSIVKCSDKHLSYGHDLITNSWRLVTTLCIGLDNGSSFSQDLNDNDLLHNC